MKIVKHASWKNKVHSIAVFLDIFNSCSISSIDNPCDHKYINSQTVVSSSVVSTNHYLCLLLSFTSLVAAVIWPMHTVYFFLQCQITSSLLSFVFFSIMFWPQGNECEPLTKRAGNLTVHHSSVPILL